MICAGCGFSADTYQNEIDCLERENARLTNHVISQDKLIEAAPEMLEMLYRLLPYVEDALQDETLKPAAVKKDVGALRSLIAKVDGNSGQTARRLMISYED